MVRVPKAPVLIQTAKLGSARLRPRPRRDVAFSLSIGNFLFCRSLKPASFREDASNRRRQNPVNDLAHPIRCKALMKRSFPQPATSWPCVELPGAAFGSYTAGN